ncbi:MAG TPA: hypothetical protein VLC92_01115 [Rhodocyclaceae bacterium]|nr:hypothetical protein [Rhodocyclaceae bacterium]
MFTALISFVGGNAFRWLFGEISSAWTAHQEHKQELSRMELQAKLDAQQHAQHIETLKLQADLGVKEIRVRGEMDIEKLDAEMFRDAVGLTGKATGIAIIDAWNGCIRPALATMCMGLVCAYFWGAGWKLDENGWALCGSVLGIYVADRQLFKRGK